jgi:hypothetical protein
MTIKISQKQISPLLTTDQLAAIQGANSPASSNVFATMNDLSGTVVPTGVKESGLTGSPIYYAGLNVSVAGKTAFTISQNPISESVFILFLNGQECAVGVDYTRSGMSITWISTTITLATTDDLTAWYNVISGFTGYEDSGNISCTWTAPSAVNPTTNISLIKIGKDIKLTIKGFIATANVSPGANYVISPVGIIPSQFRPSSTFIGKISAYTQPIVGGRTINVGSAIIETNGQITITNDLVGNYFNPVNGYDFGICVGAKGSALSADSETIGWRL